MKRTLALILSILMLAMAVSGCGSQSNDTAATTGKPASTAAGATGTAGDATAKNEEAEILKVGFVAPLTGAMSLTSDYFNVALQVFEEEHAKNNGVVNEATGKRYKFQFCKEDNEDKPDVTTNAYRKLIDQEGVIAVIGPESSKGILAAGPVAQEAGVPAISIFGTNEKVTQVGDYIFRVCFIDPFQGYVIAKYAYETMGARTAAILYNNADAFQVGLTEQFTANFEKLGGKVLETQAFSGDDVKDYSAQLTKIKNAKPELLMMPSNVTQAPLQLWQIEQLGIDCTIIGGDALDNPAIIEAAGEEYTDGLTFVSAFSAENPDPVAQDFVKRYMAIKNEEPNSTAVLTYEACKVLEEAVRTSKSADRKDIRDALAAINGLKLPSGVFSFDENRNPIKGAVVKCYEGKGTKLLATVDP